MKVGLISDTHGHLDPEVFRYFAGCDEIWHAGDIGTEAVLDQLEEFKPCRAVFGNVDGTEIRTRTSEDLFFELNGQRFLITHIAGKPPKYNKHVREMIEANNPDVLICGHSHFLKVQHDPSNGVLFMNPGAAGRHGFHKTRTLLRFSVGRSRIHELEVIELGSRSSL